MNSLLGIKERENFSDRLKDALKAAGFTITPSKFAYEFNIRANGAAVSVHGARKWLIGEAIPAQERLQIMADWLGVSAAWLRYGNAENTVSLPAAAPRVELDRCELVLLHDVRKR